ncbi:MAG: YkgJ family cysteine cluster protein [Desulfohalobiaceae bacterium]|nr:YkgJ family cysteine cluster protein [Desulfohalobiaceae bacterium]
MKDHRDRCQRCGTCCRNGPPGLHEEDKPLYDGGRLGKADLLTLRTGEWVYDNIEKKSRILTEEMVRIRTKPGEGACLFFNSRQNSCEIYEHRPLECRILSCWDTRPIRSMYQQHRLNRQHLIPEDSALFAIMNLHEERCAYERVQALAETIIAKGEKKAPELAELSDIVQQDLQMRSLLQEKTEAADPVLEFVFGRSLLKTLPGFGLELRETADGYRFSKRENEPLVSRRVLF